jgi:hypothetical protein
MLSDNPLSQHGSELGIKYRCGLTINWVHKEVDNLLDFGVEEITIPAKLRG